MKARLGQTSSLACWAAATISLVAACGSPASEGEVVEDDPEDGVVVPEGKEDDFFSERASEYIVEGKTTVVIESSLANASAAKKEKRVRELIGYKQIAISWFLTQYLVDKEDDASNADYGGMGGIAKNGAFEDLGVTALNATAYEFTFRQIVAGGNNLISALPTRRTGDKTLFDLEIGKPSNEQLAQLETNGEWYRQSPWDAWNSSTVSASQKETLALSIARERASTDAWFDVNKLIADGTLDIDIHFGWDYHNAYHITHAKAMFSWLKAQGFTAPVATFAKLTRDSGPFIRTLKADGNPLTIEVRLFYGITGGANDPDTAIGGKALEADMRASLAKRDVIIYSGHSGPFYGFALANWRVTTEGDLDDSEMSSVTMPENRYQVVVAEGCDTYQVGEAFLRNPAKADRGLIDIITTTSFSNAATPESVKDIIRALIARDSNNRLRPATVKSLLTELDGNSYEFNTMYGFHGIDSNPALHPFANIGKACEKCSKNADCGDNGNMCATVGQSGKRCVAACTDDRGCGVGYACRAIASGGSIAGKACVPKNLQCQ